MEFPQKNIGKLVFTENDDFLKIKRAIYRTKNEFVLDFIEDDDAYHVNLKSEDGINFTGKYSIRNDTSTGHVRAKLYKSGDDLLLLGNWYEEENMYWFAELEYVDKFEDEAN